MLMKGVGLISLTTEMTMEQEMLLNEIGDKIVGEIYGGLSYQEVESVTAVCP